jgi:hypothetical protein
VNSDQPASTPQSGLLLALLLGVPVAVCFAKLPVFPGAEIVAQSVSVADLPVHLRRIASEIVFVPLGALVVVAGRVTIGLRVLGLFRPILLAFAFDLIGIPLGLGMLLPVLLLVLLLHPLVATGHSYGRTAVLLSLVAVLLLVPLVVGTRCGLLWLQQLAHFPLIALCLTCESFAKSVARDGVPEALWRAINTMLAAVVITYLAQLAAAFELFLRFPELLLAQAGCVLLIKDRLDLRLCEGINPMVGLMAAVQSARQPQGSGTTLPAGPVAQPLLGRPSMRKGEAA